MFLKAVAANLNPKEEYTMSTQLTVQNDAQNSNAAQSMIAVIERAANNPEVDIEKMERLLAMQERIMDRQSEIAFNEAMNACQRECPSVFKAAQNSSNRSKYAKLEAVDDAIRPVYTSHGFSLSFGSREAEDGVTVLCKVSHIQGHSRDYELKGALDLTGIKGERNKTDIMALGSSVSYLRRYLTCMIFNVILTDEDNDGQSTKANYLSPTQRDIIIEKLGGPGQNVSDFCKSIGVNRLDELDAGEFDKVVARAKRFMAERTA